MMDAAQPVAHWRWLALAAAVLGLSAVLLGAAGSHAIDLSAPAAAQRWSAALQIHYFEAAALMALAALVAATADTSSSTRPDTVVTGRLMLLSGLIQLLGTLLFCGSLYLRALQPGGLPGWITPLGGLILMAGWLLLILILIRKIR